MPATRYYPETSVGATRILRLASVGRPAKGSRGRRETDPGPNGTDHPGVCAVSGRRGALHRATPRKRSTCPAARA